MNVFCIAHEDFQKPVFIEKWAVEHGHNFKLKRPYRGDRLDEDFDFLIILGGLQSSNMLRDFPYLKDEITLIRKAIKNQKKILGFCLGAQLIGRALGRKALKSPHKELGGFEVTLTDEAEVDPLLKGEPHEFKAILWHEEMPGLTKDSVVLAENAGCPRQIVRFKSMVYGFQCHLDMDKNDLEYLTDTYPDDLGTTEYTQNKQEILSQDYQSINKLALDILDKMEKIH